MQWIKTKEKKINFKINLRKEEKLTIKKRNDNYIIKINIYSHSAEKQKKIMDKYLVSLYL